MCIAVTRAVSPGIECCQLTHREREIINFDTAAEQHARHEECLAELGCKVRRLHQEPDLPDSVFVEDTAIVLKEVAVMMRPGAESRRPEVSSVADVLSEYRPLSFVVEPGTMDGGDALILDRRLYIGLSTRTNAEGVRQVRSMLEPMGYTVTAVSVGGCLHLKSAVGRVGQDTLLINRAWVDEKAFAGVRLIDVDPDEPEAAGALWVAGTVIYPERFKRTRDRLNQAGIGTTVVEISELAKAEAGVTCCSLVFKE